MREGRRLRKGCEGEGKRGRVIFLGKKGGRRRNRWWKEGLRRTGERGKCLGLGLGMEL